MELDEQQSESEKDDAEDVEGYAKRMNAFRDNLFLKAKSSIVASQMKIMTRNMARERYV